ncbi:hypothetical protein [Sporolactobacillus putidus]|uniref:Uncharacterized protein n=1 Tax=Sporolactobacillus putidus TaxID=492735 RepID=A0A917W1K1_9BACL|nr:hypothetical protein [Sporolactobacillus putidus]GGL51058.1 hypothetical protein GCM10007968_14160 [Sporolactobacillus putidus]
MLSNYPVDQLLGDHEKCYFGGSLEARLQKIISLLNLPIVVPVPKAIEQAKKIITTNRESISKRIIEQYHEPTLKEKIKIISKY